MAGDPGTCCRGAEGTGYARDAWSERAAENAAENAACGPWASLALRDPDRQAVHATPYSLFKL